MNPLTYRCLIFDLDGTLTDPKMGIVRCLNYALEAHDFERQSEEELANYIGPPLDSTFQALTDSQDAQLITSLVTKYRERYSDVGFSENAVYPDIPQTVRRLASIPGITLAVCTSKRVDFARRILELFELSTLFSFVDGGDVGIEKWQQLEALKAQGLIPAESLMIGDRRFDLEAAHKNGLPSAGVLWGYGSQKELQAHEPAHLFAKPTELLSLCP